MRFAEPDFLWCLFTLPLFALLFAYAYHRRKKLAGDDRVPEEIGEQGT